jgi:hypothetical protein
MMVSLAGALMPESFTAPASDFHRHYRPTALWFCGELEPGARTIWTLFRYPPGFAACIALLYRIADMLDVSRAVVLTVGLRAAFAGGAAALWASSRLLWNGARAWAPALAWLLYAPALWLGARPLSETVFLPLLFVIFFLHVRAITHRRLSLRGALGMGALMGLAMLVRPIAAGLPAVSAVAIWRLGFVRDSGKAALALLGAAILVVTPWELYLANHAGRLYPLCVNGTHSAADGLTFGVRARGYRIERRWGEAETEFMHALDSSLCSRMSATGLIATVWREARDHPLGALRLAALKAIRPWYGTDSGRNEWLAGLCNLLFALPAAAGLAWRIISRRMVTPAAAATLAYVGYFWLASVAALSIARYMVPAAGLLFLWIPGLFPQKGRACT